eukprot:CAMPEP_0117456878 /NCGR_PEP_ID=MMETSP0784-20121206/79_1 /TAXON_ID=39447 /ORGANISM="" /LENGTH=137 /DNA_ID=CAMNT_0005250253 /DNA_START=192 /DNA_END=606 /DNA_ORIENTATION=+
MYVLSMIAAPLIRFCVVAPLYLDLYTSSQRRCSALYALVLSAHSTSLVAREAAKETEAMFSPEDVQGADVAHEIPGTIAGDSAESSFSWPLRRRRSPLGKTLPTSLLAPMKLRLASRTGVVVAVVAPLVPVTYLRAV